MLPWLLLQSAAAVNSGQESALLTATSEAEAGTHTAILFPIFPIYPPKKKERKDGEIYGQNSEPKSGMDGRTIALVQPSLVLCMGRQQN